MELFGLEITGDHARFVVAILGGALATLGFLAGRWSRHRNRVRFRKEDLVTSSILIEYYGVRALLDGTQELDFITQGGSESLDSFFFNPDLVAHIRGAAAKHPGLLRLAKPIAHRMMMAEGKDKITGLDPKANIDFLQGKPTREDEVLIAFAAYREGSHENNGLHDQVARLVLMVVSPAMVGQFADQAFVRGLAVPHAGYAPRRDRLHDFAQEWQRLEQLPHADRSGGTDAIWKIVLRSSI